MDIHRIEESLSKVPAIKPPKEIYIFDKIDNPKGNNMYDLIYHPESGRITSDEFFELAVYHHNAMDGGKWIVRGMTPADKSEAIYTTDSTQNTVFHEPLHGMGIRSEIIVRPLAQMASIRSMLNLGFRRRNVKYQEVPMTEQEKLDYMRRRGIRPDRHVNFPIKKYRLVSE